MVGGYKKVDLSNLNSGAAIDLFEAEFQKVLKNLADENTRPDAVREIKLTVKIKPSKNRGESATTEVSVVSKLAPIKPHESFMVLNFDGNTVEAYTTDINQKELPYGEGENEIAKFKGAVGK